MGTFKDAEREARKELRERLIGDVLYSDDSGSSGETYAGLIFDLSPSGLCIITHKPIAEGASLKIYGKKLWEDFRYAKVRWSRRISPDIYRAGLSFN